jgi:hypothetical protein
VEEVGLSEVGSSGKVSLSETVVLALHAVEAGAVKEGSGFLPSRRVLGCAIKPCAIKAGQVWIRSVPSKVRPGFAPCLAGKLDLGSLNTL